ncbi:MAG: succinate dehydrogenase assembly factor 2 [Pseudomonadota bacterium]
MQPPTQPPEDSTIAHKRAYWRSRRGMSELENWLLPFVVHRFMTLSEAEQHSYLALLDIDDWDLFDWLQERQPATTADFAALVAKIRSYRFSDDFPSG